MRRLFAIPLLLAGPVCAAEGPPPLRVDIDFPGGSALVEEIDQEERLVRIVPTPHEGRGWEVWWYFKLSGVEPGETITLDVGKAPWATPDRAAVSTDGESWSQTARGRRVLDRVLFRHEAESEEIWFAWGPPFLPEDAGRVVEAAARSPYAEAFELCRSAGGRPVPALRVRQSEADDEGRYGVWILARQHAWESGSSWVCRGLIEWLVSRDPRAAALRRKAELTIVPLMDVDNVAIGAGGKFEDPRDHNRDWDEEPHHPAVRAAMDGIRRQDEAGRFDLFLDLHNPGRGIQDPFFFSPVSEWHEPAALRNRERFVESAAAEILEPFSLRRGILRRAKAGDEDTPSLAGILVETGGRQWEGKSTHWALRHTADHVVSLCLETPWNTPHSHTEGYRAVGSQLGLAIERYFREDVREPPGR